MATSPAIIDDHLLIGALLGEPAVVGLLATASPVLTTGLWYHRLCRAIAVPTVSGALTKKIGAANPAIGAAAVRAVTQLPQNIGLTSLRELAWPMGQLLNADIELNLLSLEALAAAEHLGGAIWLAAADQNPTLLAAAKTRGVPTRIV